MKERKSEMIPSSVPVIPSEWEAENYRSFHVDVPRPDGSTARMIFYHPEDTGGEVDLAFRVAAIGCTQLKRWAVRNLDRAHVFSVTAGTGAKTPLDSSGPLS